MNALAFFEYYKQYLSHIMRNFRNGSILVSQNDSEFH